MAHILLKQIQKDGTHRTWVLRDEAKKYTFGRSKFCEISSVDPTHEAIMGFFEKNKGHWYYVDLSQASAQMAETRFLIEDEFNYRHSNSQLKAVVLDEKEKLVSRLQKMNLEISSQQGSNRNKKLLVKVARGMIIESRIVDKDQRISPLDEPVEIIEKEIVLFPNMDILKNHLFKEVDSDTLKIFGGSFLLGLSLLAMASTFKSKPLFITSSQWERPVNAPRIIQSPRDLREKKRSDEAPQPSSLTPSGNLSAAASSRAGSSKDSKTIVKGRISKLIGKISATAAQTQNLIVATGQAAGKAPSARSLAMVGPVDRSGKDWGRESRASGITVSTAGLGGQQTLSTQLKPGSTGPAGVGLIEDEIEMGGGLDREVIAQYIKSQLGHILYCYERQLSASPHLFGKIAVKFTIGRDGQVIHQRINDSTLNHLTVQGCILERISKWKFPAPKGGTQVVVTYPFLFKSTN